LAKLLRESFEMLLHPGPQMRSRPKNRRSLVLHKPTKSINALVNSRVGSPLQSNVQGPPPDWLLRANLTVYR